MEFFDAHLVLGIQVQEAAFGRYGRLFIFVNSLLLHIIANYIPILELTYVGSTKYMFSMGLVSAHYCPHPHLPLLS